jgi:glycosyltransferase involved in cell wall biosynthesis
VSKRYKLAFVTSATARSFSDSRIFKLLLDGLSRNYDACLILEKLDIDIISKRHDIEVQSATWFAKNATNFDRIFYDVANAPGHYFMWSLFDKFPGVVLLRDLYLSDALSYRSRLKLCTIESIQSKVYQEHGYRVFGHFSKSKYDFEYLRQFPMVLEILQSSLLIIVECDELRVALLRDYSKGIAKKLVVIHDQCQDGAAEYKIVANSDVSATDEPVMSDLASKYTTAIENAYGGPQGDRFRIIQSLRVYPLDEFKLRVLSQQLDEKFPVEKTNHRLFLDVSRHARDNIKTGIQRVTHNLLIALIGQSQNAYRVEPVYAEPGSKGYFFARKFTQALLETDGGLEDSPVKFLAGDVFLGLDLCCSDIVEQADTLKAAHAQGVKVLFLVHDLLPVTQPSWFPLGAKSGFEAWLQIISQFDGAFCVSKETAKQLRLWQAENFKQLGCSFEIHVCQNGVSNMIELLTQQRSTVHSSSFASLKQRPTFLMVGTVEPRKGYSQVLDAFDRLWSEGGDYNLVFVGKKGWSVDQLVSRVVSHPELMDRLFWYQDLNDDGLVALYKTASCLIAASEAEGFGLPLIEAAQFGLPIMARDIPVFREVADGAAYFFKASNGAELTRAIEAWLELFGSSKAPDSKHLLFLSWDQCAKNYSNVLESYFQ